MKKKFFNWPVMGVVLVTMLLMVNINAMAYKDSDLTKPAFSTDKSDRSLIKEILVNQKQMLSLIKDVKSSCKAR